ncbi:Purple acid phosphatase 15, partial [Mucuna pruriens]
MASIVFALLHFHRAFFLLLNLLAGFAHCYIPSTLEGPFHPVTVPFDPALRGVAVDLPDTDPRVRRRVRGFEPEQISVSLSTAHDSVWISWITGEFQIGFDITPLDPNTVSSVVQYGTSRFELVHEASGQSLIYNQLYPFEGLQNYTSGIIHHVRLTGLEPSTVYYYQCGDPSQQAMSDIYYFRTMPISDPQSYPGKVAVVGDLGLTYNTTTTISHLTSNEPDLLLLIGDVTYANLYLTNGTGSDCYSCSFPQTPIHETYQPRWDYWGRLAKSRCHIILYLLMLLQPNGSRFMQNLVSKVPIMVVEGNHEIEFQAENRAFVAYSSRFAFPSEESGSSSTFYYSFNAGGIHFIMLGAYIDYDKTVQLTLFFPLILQSELLIAMAAEQYKWLERDLASVDRSITPWLVATWHPPWYSSYEAHYREAECMRVEVEGLLYSYGVDIVFNGHVHAYERSNRVYNYNLDPCGPVYITVGDGGNREKMAINFADEPGHCPDPLSTPDPYMGGFCATNFTFGPTVSKFCWDRQPDYSAFRESSFGYGILEVKNETWALWSWYRNQDSYKEVGDQIYIVRQPDICPVHQRICRDFLASI